MAPQYFTPRSWTLFHLGLYYFSLTQQLLSYYVLHRFVSECILTVCSLYWLGTELESTFPSCSEEIHMELQFLHDFLVTNALMLFTWRDNDKLAPNYSTQPNSGTYIFSALPLGLESWVELRSECTRVSCRRSAMGSNGGCQHTRPWKTDRITTLASGPLFRSMASPSIPRLLANRPNKPKTKLPCSLSFTSPLHLLLTFLLALVCTCQTVI